MPCRSAPRHSSSGATTSGTVMKAARSKRAVLLGHGYGGMLAMFFASTYPEQTSALILVDACARTLRDVDHPWGLPPDRVPQVIELIEKRWGTGASLEVLAPSVARDERFRRWYARYERLAMGPGGMRAMLTSEVQRDLRSVLSAIRVPPLVGSSDRVTVDALAHEVGPLGVTVNCVSAGFVDTELTAGLSAARGDPARASRPARGDRRRRRLPLLRPRELSHRPGHGGRRRARPDLASAWGEISRRLQGMSIQFAIRWLAGNGSSRPCVEPATGTAFAVSVGR